MRTVVSSLFISMDGVVENANEWQFDLFDDDLMAQLSTEIALIDTVLLGRVSYQEWSAYWPTSQDEPFASFINNVPKYVVSNTLKNVEWGSHQTVHLLEGGLIDGVKTLKSQPGKNIAVNGSISLVQALMEHDLLDELHLMVHPVVAGHGKRLFKEGNVKRWTLVENRTSSTGVAIMIYKRRDL